ncbi:unnamed protein product [Auanema sp. JU1783]|nr:unnamed protein product [Auanema sp. JU1783]
MNQAIFLLCLLGFSSAVVIRNQADASLTQACFHCLCLQESECKPIGCQQKHGETACGYFLLTMSHYTVCGKPGYVDGEDLTTAFKRCAADYGCSSQCVRNYYVNTGRNCGKYHETPCEMMVRNHDGGNYGCTLNGTLPLWNAVKTCCAGQC